MPTGGGLVTITGAQVATGVVGTNVLRTDSLAANTFTIEIQRSGSSGVTDLTKNGVSHFNSSDFIVDGNGFVQLKYGGIAVTAFDVQATTLPGVDPVIPTAAGIVNVNGTAVANQSVVLQTRSTALNTYDLEIQYAATSATTDATKSGVSHYNSSQFTLDANGFVTFTGATSATGATSCYFPSTLSISSDNFVLTGSPETYLEVIDSKAITAATSPVFFERFTSGSLGVTTIPAGVWEFTLYLACSSTVGSNIFNMRVNKRVIQTGMTGTFTGAGPTRTFTVTGGTPFVAGDANASKLLASLIETPTQTAWISAFTSTSVVTVTLTDPAFVNVAGVALNAIYYLLFGDNSPELSATAVTLYTVNSTQPAFTIGITDSLVWAIFATTDGNRTLSWYHGGTDHFSHFCTPLVTLLKLTGNSGGQLSSTANNFNILGAVVAAGTTPVATAGSGSTITTNVQISQAIASTDATKIGLCNFHSSQFSVDANGFVQLAGAGPAIDSFLPDSGTTPVVPNGSGQVTMAGSGSITTVGGANSLTTQLTGLTNHAVLVGAGTTTITKVGPTATIGQVLQSAGAAADPAFSTATYPLTTTINQLLFSSAANTVTGLATANRAVLTTGATGVPVLTALATDGQLIIGSTAGVPAAATLTAGAGISITNGSNSISIAVNGATVGQTITGQSGGALSPTAGNWNISGATVVAGTSPLVTSGAGSTLTINAQRSQAIAAADSTKVGLANFNSAQFTVDADGFVSTSGTGIPNTITGDTGGALSPTAGNWNILGGPGVTTVGSGSTLTINSVQFTDTAAATLAVDNGYFATAAGTYPLPATALQGEILIIVCDTAGAVVLDAPALNFIRIGSSISSSGGTATSNAIGDSLTLRYRLSSLTWEATSVIGTWTTA